MCDKEDVLEKLLYLFVELDCGDCMLQGYCTETSVCYYKRAAAMIVNAKGEEKTDRASSRHSRREDGPCKYMSEDGQDMCGNADCPAVADFCPVTGYQPMCRFYEEKQL